MPGPYCGTETLTAAISAKYDALEGIHSKTYKKKGGKTALKVKFEKIANGFAGCNDTFISVHRRDIVTLPLTSFNPKSRNTTSKKSINSYVCTNESFLYGIIINV
jgi:hypothetical protein